jgi:hypothetical protein
VVARAIAFALISLCALAANAADVLGKKPAHILGGPSSVPNEQAITRMIWAPGIDEGYVPQGVAWDGGAIFVSAYRSSDPKIDGGPCRVFKVDPSSGAASTYLDLPADCHHAGGIVQVAKGVLVVSDTRRLYRIQSGVVTASVALGGEVKGSFIAFDGKALFSGTYDKDASRSKGHYLPLSIFSTHDGRTVDQSNAIATIPLPPLAQGATFDKAGNLWITSSSSRLGALYRVDAKTGAIASRYEIVIGVEGMAFDDDGLLWSISEAGSLRWQRWSHAFPVVFRFDPGKLVEGR